MEGLPMELLNANDLAETQELSVEKIQKWKKSMVEKGLREDKDYKTKIVKCEARFAPTENRGKWPCGVRRMGPIHRNFTDLPIEEGRVNNSLDGRYAMVFTKQDISKKLLLHNEDTVIGYKQCGIFSAIV